MSTEQENFDDILRSKLSEGEFEFNEANWDKAEALIIQADKKRKRRRIGFIFFIGLVLGVCLMIPFIGGKKESLTNKDNKVNIEKKDVSIDNNTKTENKEGEEKAIVQQERKTTSNTDIKNNKQSDVIQTNKDALKEGTVTTSQKEEKHVNNKSSQKNVSSEMLPNSVKKEVNPINTKPSKSNTTNDVLVSNSSKNKTSNTERQKSRSEAGNTNTMPSNTNGKELLNNHQDVENTLKQDQVATKLKETQSLSKIVDTPHISTSTNSGVVKDTVLAAKDSVAKTKADSVKPLAKETTPEVKKESLKQATIFCIDAGANYALGWKYNTTNEAAGFNAVIGASMMHYFSAKWSILVGLQYNSLAHLSYSNYSSTGTQYNFGYNQTKTTVTPKMIYYIGLPIKWQYHINENNGISLGANILYLLNTSSTVDTYAQTDFTTSNHTTVTKKGYMDGFSTWDIQPALAYRRRIYKGFSVSAEAYYGLIDIKSNSFFGINKSEKNSGFKLVLSYSFVK